MIFDDLDLEDDILDGLWAMNFKECTPIQEKAIPLLLEGKDLIGCAQTGTGKTAAYLLPILNGLVLDKPQEDAIHAVIMVPTRELAQQIDQQVQGFAYYIPVSSVAIYGGSDGMIWEQQKKGIDAGADIIIATPGRLLSYIKLGLIDLTHVRYFVLDEADRMLDMGFVDDIMQVMAELPKRRQNMLFSATMPPKIRALAKQMMTEPAEIRLSVSKPNENIHQLAFVCYEIQKPALVKHLLKDITEKEKVLIFASSKIKVKEVSRILQQLKLHVIEMHSDLNQAMREEVMYRFKTGQNNILVATDIVSRGIDIDDIALVINYDVPHDPEDYVHRIGRTARAGESGKAATFISEDDQLRFAVIEDFLEKEIEKALVPEELGETPSYNPKRGRRSHSRDRHRSSSRRQPASDSTKNATPQQNSHKKRGKRNGNAHKAQSGNAPDAQNGKTPGNTRDTARNSNPNKSRHRKKTGNNQSNQPQNPQQIVGE